MNKTYVGIDPGKTGAIAIIYPDNTTAISMMPTYEVAMKTKTKKGNNKKKTFIDGRVLFAWLISHLGKRDNPKFYIENVNAMPGQGVTSSFSFGEGVGTAKGVISTLGEFTTVRPMAWKKEVLKDYDWKGNKEASILFAENNYPDACLLPTPRCTKPSDGIAEAICIAEYGRLTDE